MSVKKNIVKATTIWLSSAVTLTAWKVTKYGVFSGPYFPIFSPNAGKCGPEQTPHLDTFHTASVLSTYQKWQEISAYDC